MTWDEHFKNREALPEEELAKYYGRHVAWSSDGTCIVASGTDDLQVWESAKAAGFDPQQLVFSYVPFPDEVILGGVLGLQEERQE